MNRLLDYLETNGILLCNANPYLPALEDVGCAWQDVTELIDNHLLFYSKAYQKRTAYLSREVYYLLKAVKPQKPLIPAAETLYDLLKQVPMAEASFLKRVSALTAKEYSHGFDFLLQNLYITAVKNGTALNENWSTFYYGTSAEWEKSSTNIYSCSDPAARLWEILSHTMTEKQFHTFVK